MLTLKQLWLDKSPYGNGKISFKPGIEFVKEHGPIFLAGVHVVLFHNLKWIKRFIKAGIWIATETGQIEQVEPPRKLPPPKQPTSI